MVATLEAGGQKSYVELVDLEEVRSRACVLLACQAVWDGRTEPPFVLPRGAMARKCVCGFGGGRGVAWRGVHVLCRRCDVQRACAVRVCCARVLCALRAR